MLNLYQLRIFILVAEARTLSAAAEQLYITQPAVSRQLQLLQSTYHVRLFERRGPKTEPTEAARVLLPAAREVVRLAEQFEALLGTARTRNPRPVGRWRYQTTRAQTAHDTALVQLDSQVCLGCAAAFSNAALQRILRSFHGQAGDLRLALERGETEEIVRRVREGALDCGIIDERPRGRGLRIRRLLIDEIVLLVPADHRWAQRGAVKAGELLDEPIIVQRREGQLRRVLEVGLDRHQVQFAQLPVVLDVDSSYDAVAAVTEGLGISFVSKGLVEGSSSKTKVVAIEGVTLRREILLVHRPEENLAPAGRRLEAFLRSPLAAKLLAGEG